MRIIKTLGYGVAVVAIALVQAISPAMSAYATAAAVANPTETTSAPAPVTTPQVEAKVATCTDNTFDMTLSNDAGTQDYTVWTKLKLDFTGAIPDGMTTYTKTAILPPELSGNAATYNLYAPDGTTVMGHMVSDGHTVTFTFDAAYISTHDCITWNATLYAGFATTVDPGTPYNLEFLLDGTTKTFPITIGECPYCNTLYTGPDKWAVVADDTHTVVSGINSHVTTADNETITITDVVDSHQTLRCDDISVFQQGNMLDNRGSLVREADVTADATITCSAHTVTMVLAKTLAHKVYTLYVLATADGTLPAYVDTATIIQGGVTYKQNATATVYGGGGGGNGTQLIPEIAIEKWDTDRTTGAHDSADDAKKLDAHTDQLIHFAITNTGN